ncbi:MAG TPA: cupin domain-containing protein [Anaerolineaceae bacterium]|nr:cupin domain-containing protein [Anaerolineaceae bacterium]
MAHQGQVIENPRTGQVMNFLLTGADTQGELLRIECTNAPIGVKEPEHIHPYQENRFEVLSGTLTLRIDGEERQVLSGEMISIPPNVPHYFWNATNENVHYLQEFRPALRSEYFFEILFHLARDGKLDKNGKPGMLQAAVIIPTFWDEIRVTNPPPRFQKIFFGLLNPIGRMLGYQAVL